MNVVTVRAGKIVTLLGLALYLVLLILSFHPQRLSVEEHGLGLPTQVTESVIQISEGFQYRETEEGKTVFAISASKLVGYERNTYELEDVTLLFVTDDGEFHVTCRSVDFDANTRDFGIQGNIFVTTEWGLIMWTEEMAYRHRSRFLLGMARVSFIYGDSYWGELNRPVLDVRRNVLSVSEGVLIEDPYGNHFDAETINVALKSGTLTFPEGVFVAFGGFITTLDYAVVRQMEKAVTLTGECVEGQLNARPVPAEFRAPAIHAAFQRAEGLQPGHVRFDQGVEWVRGTEKVEAGVARLHFKAGELRAFTLTDWFTLKGPDGRLSGWDGDGHVDPETGELNLFNAFGDILFCSDNLLARSERFTANFEKNTFTFREECMLRQGAWDVEGRSMVYDRGGDELQIHDDVRVVEVLKDLHVNADHAHMISQSQAASFTGAVHAWTADYDLISENLRTTEDTFQASGDVKLETYSGRREILEAEHLEVDQRSGRMSAWDDVHVRGDLYEARADTLSAWRTGEVWSSLNMTGDVSLVDEAQGITGTGDRLDLLRGGGEVIFLEGCPARVVDREEQTVSAPNIILDRSWGQIYLIGAAQPSTLEVKSEQSHIER